MYKNLFFSAVIVSTLTACNTMPVPVLGADIHPKLAVKEELKMTDSERYAAYRPAQSCKEIAWNISYSRGYIERASKESAHSASSLIWNLNIINGDNKWNGLKLAEKNLKDNQAAYNERCK